MPAKTLFLCFLFSCQMQFASHSWLLKHIKLHHPEHVQVPRQKHLAIHSKPRRVEPAQHHEFNSNYEPGEDLDACPYLEQVENIAVLQSQPPPPPPLLGTESYPGAGGPLSNYITEPWERDAQGCLEKNEQNNPYYQLATGEIYQYIQCRIIKQGMKMYYDNLLKDENTTLSFSRFKNGDRIQKLVARMPDDLALWEWKLHTIEDMRWNDNHRCPIKYWSGDIITSMRWWMSQPAYAEHNICAPQRCCISDTPPKHLYTEMHTANWWSETQVRRDTRG